jgi:ABC-2 family transporter protein
VLTGALNAALDTTAGERERGSLEPLLMNPAERWALVLGKWGAVASVGMLIAVLSCFSFLPGQWLLRSDTLAAMFQYGVREALLFLVVLLPFAAAASALLMAVAIRCKSFKEAQASTTVVMLTASLLPLINVPVDACAGAERVDDARAEGRCLDCRAAGGAARGLCRAGGGRRVVRGAHAAQRSGALSETSEMNDERDNGT